jgi:hypothetical protein
MYIVMVGANPAVSAKPQWQASYRAKGPLSDLFSASKEREGTIRCR